MDHYDDDEVALQKLFAAVDHDLLTRGWEDDERLSDDERKQFLSDSHVVYCSTFISALKHPNFQVERRVGRKSESLFDCLHAHGFRRSIIHEILMQHTPNSFDMRLIAYVARREQVQEVAQQLADAAKGFRFLKGLHLPYRRTREGEELIGDLDRFAAAEIPRQLLTRDPHPNLHDWVLNIFGGSALTPTVEFRSPLRFPTELIELFYITPRRLRGRSQMAKVVNEHLDAAIERLENKRGFDRERRVEAGPKDIDNIAMLIDDLAEEVARTARLLKRPIGRRVEHAQRSFRRAFATHSQVLTGSYHDEIGTALYSMTFHQQISVSDYRRLRQLDSSEAKKRSGKS